MKAKRTKRGLLHHNRRVLSHGAAKDADQLGLVRRDLVAH